MLSNILVQRAKTFMACHETVKLGITLLVAIKLCLFTSKEQLALVTSCASLCKTSVKGKENRFSLLLECSSTQKPYERWKYHCYLHWKGDWEKRRSCWKELKQLNMNLDKWRNRNTRLHWWTQKWTQKWTHTSRLLSCYVDHYVEKIRAVLQVSGRSCEACQPSFHTA